MKLELQRQNFLKIWQIAERVAETKTTKDSISGVFITAGDDDTITLEATDLKTSVKCRAAGANVLDPGSAVVPAAIFGSMLKKASSEDLVLEINSSRGLLTAGRSKTRFAVIPAEEFPKIPESDGADEICEINSSDLSRAITEGSSAASQPVDFPKYMGTCLLKTSDGYLKAVSTDGKRLAVSKVLCMKMTKEQELLLTAPATKDLGKTLASSYADKNVKILADNSTVWFRLDDIEFSIRSVDAAFPPYERILNNEVYTTLKVQTSDLASVLERIDIIAKTTPAHIMSMQLDTDGEVRVTARAPEKGTASEVLQAEVTGNNLNIGFNVGYFLDGLRAIGSGEALIEFSSDEGQSRMYRSGTDDLLYMLMPARLSAQDRITDEEMSDFFNASDEIESEQESAPENNNSDDNHEDPF